MSTKRPMSDEAQRLVVAALKERKRRPTADENALDNDFMDAITALDEDYRAKLEALDDDHNPQRKVISDAYYAKLAALRNRK